jgi:hypothetical protein
MYYLARIEHFLKEIGIDYHISNDDFDSFLGGIKIEHGKWKINLRNLMCLGDILHEAGHLACIPSALRLQANDDIKESLGEEFTFEMGVIAWSVLATKHLGIPLSEIFHQDGYNGNAEWLLEQYSSNNYIGLPLLQWMGLVTMQDESKGNEQATPLRMIRWTRA